MNKKIIWIIIGCVVLLLAVMYFKKDNVQETNVVAVVGDQQIKVEEWEDELKQQYGEAVLQKMIDSILVYQEAERIGVMVTDEEVKMEMANLQQKYNGDQDSQTFTEQMGMTEEQIKEELKYAMLLEELAMKDVHITEAEIKNYYEQNLEQYIEPAQVYLYQIVVDTREAADEIVEELIGGTSFSSLAVERSADILDLGNGGNLGWVSYNDPYIDPVVLNEAFQIEIGEISAPIKTEYGYAVIKVTERKEERQNPLEEVKREIRREIAFRQSKPLPEILKELREKAGVKIFIDSY